MELNLKELAEKIHENAKSKGFYDNKDHIFFEYAQVFEIIKEVAEFHEAYKKGKDGAGDWYLENPEEIGESPVFLACIKDTWQDELADIMIRLLDYAAFVGFELPQYKPTKTDQVLDNYELGNYCLDWVLKLTDMAY
jgi:NTP pyrophosphatase (non-canonical NTP hydrolase)